MFLEKLVSKSRSPGFERVHARKVINRMPGESQADLVLTDCGYYVVKWLQNPCEHPVLLNEAIGSELLSRLGIATPPWAAVDASKSFLRANPSSGIRINGGIRPIEPGRHFGSKVPTQKIHDSLPLAELSRVHNIRDFARTFVFDLWVNNQDRRQAVFSEAPNGRFSAQMIDQGRAFGFDGSEWQLKDWTSGYEYPPLSAIYLTKTAAHDFECTLLKIDSLKMQDFDRILQDIPAEWVGPHSHALHQMLEDLLRRSRRLPDLLTAARSQLLSAA